MQQRTEVMDMGLKSLGPFGLVTLGTEVMQLVRHSGGTKDRLSDLWYKIVMGSAKRCAKEVKNHEGIPSEPVEDPRIEMRLRYTPYSVNSIRTEGLAVCLNLGST